LINSSIYSISVYPPSGSSIDANAANVAFSLPAGAKIMFMGTSTTKYYTLNASLA